MAAVLLAQISVPLVTTKKLQMFEEGVGNIFTEIPAKPGLFGNRRRAGSCVDKRGNQTHIIYGRNNTKIAQNFSGHWGLDIYLFGDFLLT